MNILDIPEDPRFPRYSGHTTIDEALKAEGLDGYSRLPKGSKVSLVVRTLTDDGVSDWMEIQTPSVTDAVRALTSFPETGTEYHVLLDGRKSFVLQHVLNCILDDLNQMDEMQALLNIMNCADA